jgi:uncharacterized protein (TIGR03437 family)
VNGESDAFVAKLNPGGTALVYSTRLGGEAVDVGLGIAVDTAGAAYVSGTTFSRGFPSGATSLQPRFGGGSYDAFVVKLNAGGTALIYSTYLGGSGDDDAWAIAVDANGVANVVGTTTSPDFVITADALQTTFGGGDGDVFFTRLNAAGAATAYSTYFGWRGFDEGFNLTLDAARNAYITGAVDSGFPTTPNTPGTTFGGGDADGLVAKIAEEPGNVPAPRISSAGILNAAGFTGGAVAPGEMVTIFGEDIGSTALRELKLTASGRVDTSLGVTRVLFDDVAAPLVYVLPRQISAVVPYEVAGRSAVNVVVMHRGIRSNIANVPVAPAAPGIFTANAQGNGQAAVLNADNSANTPSNPAARGSFIQIYATGAGQTVPAGITGFVPTGPSSQVLPVTVTIGSVAAEVLYAGNAPTFVSGVLQVNARVPEVPPGVVSLVLTVGGQPSQANVTVAVR